MHTLRTKFKNEIIAEFLIPKRKSAKVIIFCDGLPSVPSKKPLLEFFAKKGYWVFHPRYRGTWESEGKFLQKSPEKDILDVIDQLPKGFKDLYDGTIHKINPKTIYIFGGSAGGPAAILASRNPTVTKAVVFAPVVDWNTPTETVTIDSLAKFTKIGFGNGYRLAKNGWDKLKTGKFYNPINHIKEINGRKIFIIHAKDDTTVLWKPVEKFAKEIGCKLLLTKKGEHFSSSNFIEPYFYKQIKKFLKTA
ncbi:prolyl oligopeptidase family serine peptidase [Candidatus Parcubacteria bacterium]|nr:prolyl oligopeptidase family serine peptidase [Candidatus Parcubacteria bacterium]